MARGDTTAQAGEKQALSNSTTSSGNAAQTFAQLSPQLAGDIAHPAGYSPTDLAKMQTEAQQTAGGANAGAEGEAALRTARTRNAGGADAALGQSATGASQGLSQAALRISGQNADVKQRQRAQALGEEGGLYGTSLGGATSSLDAAAGLSNANTNASNASWNWAKYILDPAMQAAGSAAGGGAFK